MYRIWSKTTLRSIQFDINLNLLHIMNSNKLLFESLCTQECLDLTCSVLYRWSVNRWQPDVFKKSAASRPSSTLYWRQSAVLLLHQLVTSCFQFTSSFCQKRAKRSLFVVITFSASAPVRIFSWSHHWSCCTRLQMLIEAFDMFPFK